MQTGHGNSDCNGKQGKDCYWGRGGFQCYHSKGKMEDGVCEKYSLGRGYEAGRDLVDWCEEMGMAHVNSFMRYKREGHMETSGDWDMARVRWVFGERGRETEDGEKGLDERGKGVVGS